MNSNLVKPENFGHLHLVYHFTIPLSTASLTNGVTSYALSASSTKNCLLIKKIALIN